MRSLGFLYNLAVAALTFVPVPTLAASTIRHVFVIPMENHDASQIFGNPDAPYINSLLTTAARAKNFEDELPDLKSEPHYLYMEAGTNHFHDYEFRDDGDPSARRSTSSGRHLAAQISDAANVSWMSYQEGIGGKTCPINSKGYYAAKHNPFIFFQDIAGNPPSESAPKCIAHMKSYHDLQHDLANNHIAEYVFITPNLCHDMHSASGCNDDNLIRRGDTWLKSELPPLIKWANANGGVIFLTWDEGDDTSKLPFLAIGTGVKKGYTGLVNYDHGSIIRTVEEIFGLPILPTVSDVGDLSDLFLSGVIP